MSANGDRPGPLARLLSALAVLFFNVLLVLCTLPSWLAAKFAVIVGRCRPLRDYSRRSTAVFVLTCLGWRLLFALCCWIRVTCSGLAAFRAGLGKSGRPVVIVANHNSFLDTILLVALVPVSQVYKVKMFVSSHLMKMPILRTIVTAMRHLAVPFKACRDSNSFELDRELMAERQRVLEDHVRAGGIAGWFPEGRMNPDDEAQVGMFRAGGFALASRIDVEIWCVAFRGNSACWPRTAAAGGLPARIGIEIFKLCDSSFDFVAASSAPLPDEKARTILLANACRDRIQHAVDQLASVATTQTRPSGGGAGEPLLKP